MKATGIVRKIDDMGRIVIPKELRRELGIEIKDPLEMYTDKEYVILKKFTPKCIICGNQEDLIEFKGKNFCHKCIEEFGDYVQKEGIEVSTLFVRKHI